MPIDVDYPKDRINFMLENSKTKIVVTANNFEDNIEYNGTIIDINQIDFNKKEKTINRNIRSMIKEINR